MDVTDQTTTKPDIEITDTPSRNRVEIVRRPGMSVPVKILSALAGLALIVGIVLGIMQIIPQNQLAGLQTNRYQAVFLTNGQVYFGKLRQVGNDNVKITDIYYLQTQSQPPASTDKNAQNTETQNNVQLIKLGQEIHGPADSMFIPRSQMLFWENLKDGGKVANAIREFQAQNSNK